MEPSYGRKLDAIASSLAYLEQALDAGLPNTRRSKLLRQRKELIQERSDLHNSIVAYYAAKSEWDRQYRLTISSLLSDPKDLPPGTNTLTECSVNKTTSKSSVWNAIKKKLF